MVKTKLRVPAAGDMVWLTFSPQTGREQSGRRPALVISPKIYNRKTDLALFCPITSQEKGYPFEVKIPSGLKIEGVILSDQIRSLDWRARKSEFICKLPEKEFEEALNKLGVLIGSQK